MNSDTFSNLKRKGVGEDILEAFKRALILGDLQPGHRLPSEFELAQKFGVGRSALREAMKMLSAMGVVDIKQGDGTYITSEPNPAMFRPLSFAILLQMGFTDELFEFRELIQVGYCQLAGRKATEQDLKRIEEAVEAWSSLAQSPDHTIESLVQQDLNFHYAILDATHNPFIINLGRSIEELFFASILRSISNIEGLNRGIEGHRNILNAIRSGDQEMICTVVMESLKNWETGLRQKPSA